MQIAENLKLVCVCVCVCVCVFFWPLSLSLDFVQCKLLRTLNMSDNAIGNEGVALLSKALPLMRSLTSFNLSRSSYWDVKCVWLWWCVHTHSWVYTHTHTHTHTQTHTHTHVFRLLVYEALSY